MPSLRSLLSAFKLVVEQTVEKWQSEKQAAASEEPQDIYTQTKATFSASSISSSVSTTSTKTVLLWDTLEEASAVGSLNHVRRLYQSMITTWGQLPIFAETAERTLEHSIRNAAVNNHAHIIAYFLDQGVSIRRVPSSRSVEVFRVLVDRGWSGGSSLTECLMDEDLVRWLLEHGADPNAPSSMRYSILEIAAYTAATDVVHLLVEHRADTSSSIALHMVVRSSSSTAFQLVARSANNRPRSVTECLEIMTCLLDHGVNINQFEPVLGYKTTVPLEYTCFTGTPLHRAVESGEVEIVKLLLRRGADRDIKGPMGFTPLQAAERKVMLEMVEILRHE